MTPSTGDNESVFASPPEPIFNSNCDGLPREILQDWLLLLSSENDKQINSPRDQPGDQHHQRLGQSFFKMDDCAEFVLLICSRLKLSNHATYTAMELFDRFMTKHIADLYKHVKSSSSRTKMSDWQSILDRISNQMVLRIVSCCQIASKLVSHYKIITQARARHILKEAGHRYSNDSILQSELRVLKTLDYNVSVLTPIVYVETLLEILGYNLKNCRVKIYYGVCIKLIDLFSIKRQTVYDTLYSITSRKSFCSQLQRKRFMSVECDSMLLAAATVAASVYIVDQDKADQITDELGKTTRLVTDDILDFAAILVQLVIGDDDDELSDSGSYTPRDNNKHQ